jgi:pimeloyl-ACP methyl ester carboxylesterase
MKRFATDALLEEALLAKQLIASFYGTGPAYSYWTGCSQGGRQGLTIAQRFPDLYDGIAAAAPVVGLGRTFAASIPWPRVVVRNMLDGVRPPDCEINALVDRITADCDGLDGVVDGIVSDQRACDEALDVYKYVGTEFACPTSGRPKKISREAALYVAQAYAGPRDADGRFMWWFGFNAGSELTNPGQPAFKDEMAGDFLRFFVARNGSLALDDLGRAEFEHLFAAARAEWDGPLGALDPDLRRFSRRGGKLISYHGLADFVLPEKATEDYVNRVDDATSGGRDAFYRYYQVPGLGHCYGGKSGSPTAVFAALVDWVEKGRAP